MGVNVNAEPDSGDGSPNILDSLRPIALVVIVVASGCIVWAVHFGDVSLICLTMFACGSLALFVALVAGVSIPDSMLTIGAITGLFEGIVRGFITYGVVGAIVGGPLGLIAGMIVSVPLMMLLILLILCIGMCTGREV